MILSSKPIVVFFYSYPNLHPCYFDVGSGTPATKAETPLVKKRQTKKKKNDSASKKDGKGGGSGGGEDGDESDGYEFVIVSYDNKVSWRSSSKTRECL